jgi:hypothetical protein
MYITIGRVRFRIQVDVQAEIIGCVCFESSGERGDDIQSTETRGFYTGGIEPQDADTDGQKIYKYNTRTRSDNAGTDRIDRALWAQWRLWRFARATRLWTLHYIDINITVQDSEAIYHPPKVDEHDT